MTPEPHLRLTLSRTSLRANLGLIRARVGSTPKIMAVVKANAYGLGLDPVVPILDAAGADGFFVANIEEGIQTRAFTTQPIYILAGALSPDDLALCRDHHLIPVINNMDQWDTVRRTDQPRRVAFHLDTGMNRLGLNPSDWHAIFKTRPWPDHVTVDMVLSHFACSDERDHPMNNQQARDFAAWVPSAVQRFGCLLSLANSSGIFRDPAYSLDAVRPGYALYGGNPTPEAPNPMHTVVTLQARILQVQTAPAGSTVGYGATHRLDRETRLITLGAGYADGIPRALGNGGRVYVHGVACPLVGRVSMDSMVAALPDNAPPVQVNDWADIIGPDQSLDVLAGSAGTIGYEILTSLSRRAIRTWVD